MRNKLPISSCRQSVFFNVFLDFSEFLIKIVYDKIYVYVNGQLIHSETYSSGNANSVEMVGFEGFVRFIAVAISKLQQNVQI